MVNKYARNILYLLPTNEWGTKERFAFKDITIAKKQGYNVYLCACKDSFLAKLAIELEVEVIDFHEHFLNRFSSFHKHISVKKIKPDVKFDIVHCYDFTLLISLSLQLKPSEKTALIITQDHLIEKILHRFWYRPLIARIDSLILINKNLKPDAKGNLGLPKKKIEYFGMGLDTTPQDVQEKITLNFDLYKDYILAGSYVSPEVSDVEVITPLLFALKVLNEKQNLTKKNKLVLISAVEFSSMKILPELLKTIEENFLKDDVVFVTAQDISKVIGSLNLWISNCPKEMIEDFAISALIHEVPVIFARNFCSKELLVEFNGVGETYQLKDARELRGKWEKIILGLNFYREKAKLYKFFIEREHNFKLYKMEILSLYTRTVQRRIRLFNKK